MIQNYMAIQKYNTNVDKRQLFNYEINCITDKNHEGMLPSNVLFTCISIQHFKPSMP